MGMFDYVVIRHDEMDEDLTYSYQVKIWDNALHVYRPGDRVPSFEGHDTYAIAIYELHDDALQAFLVVEDGVLRGFTASPSGMPAYDKWGRPWVGNNYSLLRHPFVHPKWIEVLEKTRGS